tara:strand:- start:568 stop:2451 length:1884 start_codon:yes stop_codon:yes gene_type:complete
MNKSINRNHESGVILIASTMGVFILLSIFAFYLARFAVTESMTGGYHTLDIKTRNLALTGLEHGIQSYKSSRTFSTINGSFNNGNYTVQFDNSNNESGSSLPYTNYTMIKSTATINDVERNLRLIISTMPEAFCFSYYGDNANNQTFSESNGSISGDLFYNGNIQESSGTNSGTSYTSTGTGGTLLSSHPPFPQLNETMYNNLISSAASATGNYINTSLEFNSSDYVSIGNHNDINRGIHGQRTIEAWFKTYNKNSTTKQIIFEVGGGTRGLNIYIQSGTLYAGGWNRRTNESNWSPGTWLNTASINNNQWHHVALVLNGGSSKSPDAIKLYLDGSFISSGEGSQLWGHNPANIGRTINGARYHDNSAGNGFTFNGKIDEVRIWNVARSLNQIATKKDTVLNGNESGLTAYYNFQENSGTTANDSQTQSNNDGTISGASWTSGPILSKMNASSLSNTTINLSSFPDNKLLVNDNLTISNCTVNGPGYIVADGNITIGSNSTVNGNIFIISNGTITISSSQLGTGLNAAVVLYSKNNATYTGSTIYGCIISKGSVLAIDDVTLRGAILNYGQSFSLDGNTGIIGSVVSKYSVDFEGNSVSITKGSLPPFTGYNIGLDPIVVPGSYLEY